MSTQRLLDADSLADFVAIPLTFNQACKTVYISGTGPAVIVMAEMPGISPHVARFARWLREAGFTVYMPSLFGTDGTVPNVEDSVNIFKKACVSAEFRALGGNATSPVTKWLRELARHAHHECGGYGVGVIGMCFTGNFALTMMLEPAVIASVISQPSLPLDNPSALEISPEDLSAVRARMDKDNLTALAYRFVGDRFCKAERFAAYTQALGDRFQSRVLPDSAANQKHLAPFFEHVVKSPHSVLTAHLIDEAGQPTIAARDEVIAYFAQCLFPRID